MEQELRAQKIRLLVFDVDGVLTDGRLLVGPDGEAFKVFHAQDGLGITAAHRAGLKTAVITGRESRMVQRRGEELRITEICQKCRDKTAALLDLAAKYHLALAEVAFVGDDLNDLAVMSQVGLACAVANAVPEVKEAAHYIAAKPGGQGAVREIIEFVLKSQNKWEDIVSFFRRPGSIDARQ